MSHLNNVRQEHKLISHPPKSLSRRPLRPITAAAKLQRFMANGMMKFVIIPEAINRVIKTMCGGSQM
jgi:23S rRNA G2445 N2-methylase RlmL